MNDVYITCMQEEIDLLLDKEYPTPRERMKAIMVFIIRHEQKQMFLVEMMIHSLLHRQEDDVIRSGALRTTFRYSYSLPSWGRLLYEKECRRPSLFSGLINEITYLNYLRSHYS